MAFLSTISIFGLALGVAALLISIALLSGLQGHIKEQLIASSPQLLIEPNGRNTIDDFEKIDAEGKRLGMTTIHPVITGISWGANDEERRGRPLRVRSYERGSEPQIDRSVRRASRPIDPEEPSIFLTRDAASALGLDLGEFITIVAPRTRLTPFGPVPVWRKYRIARFVNAPQDTEAYLEMSEAAHLFGTDGKPTSIEMYGSVERAEEIQSQLARQFPGVQVNTWKEINRPIFLALRLEKIVLFVTISLIIFVAALNLISSLSMMILEKRPSVGVLRTLGATEGGVYAIFLQVGLFIGITGTILGNVFGVGLAVLFGRYHLIHLPRSWTFLEYLPFALDTSDIVLINVVAVLLSLVATWYPARIAAKLDPINAIKEEA